MTMHAASSPGANDDIGTATRLELYRLQIEIRDCEKRSPNRFEFECEAMSHLVRFFRGVSIRRLSRV